MIIGKEAVNLQRKVNKSFNDLDDRVILVLRTSSFPSEIFFLEVYQEVRRGLSEGRSGLLSGPGEDGSSRLRPGRAGRKYQEERDEPDL